ncbi:MAG: hypothetical protein AAFR61_03315 [Bacteroidota bacterium]
MNVHTTRATSYAKLLFMLLVIGPMRLLSQSDFIQVSGTHFELKGKPYYFMGTNFWYGMNLGSEGAGGDRARLIEELDQLSALGVNNLRIMAASEGPDDEPWRMLPSLQPAPGKYNEALWAGLDFLLDEMGKRNMYAVVCLNNMWPWSGGMAQYHQWFGGGDAIPYPPPADGGDWARYQIYTTRFYKNREAKQAFENHIQAVIERTNSINGKPYKDDPTIMAWEIANEPRGILKKRAYRKWLKKTATFIKFLDQNHLVTTGSEGFTPSKFAGTRFRKDHASKNIDYTTLHIWVQNWGWYDPEKGEAALPGALEKARKYLSRHQEISEKLGKPMVLEEFGISRDGNDHAASAPVTIRDTYYKEMFQSIFEAAKAGSCVAGLNFWAWGGQGRPREPHAVWKQGDDFIGDPPHEYQGWYSVYDQDVTTQEIIRKYAKMLDQLSE